MPGLYFPLEGYTLEKAGDSDDGYLLDTVAESITESVPRDEAAMSDLWIEDILGIMLETRMSGDMANELYVLRDADGNRAGVLWMGVSRDQFTCDETGFVLQIFVEKALRRRGLGRALMESAESWCESKGLLSLTLNAGCVNDAANRLYASSGFSPRTVIMRKELL